MARDAMGVVGIDMEDDGESLSEPKAISEVKTGSAADILTLVDVDFGEYRRKNDMRTVKKNCTMILSIRFKLPDMPDILKN